MQISALKRICNPMIEDQIFIFVFEDHKWNLKQQKKKTDVDGAYLYVGLFMVKNDHLLVCNYVNLTKSSA